MVTFLVREVSCKKQPWKMWVGMREDRRAEGSLRLLATQEGVGICGQEMIESRQ